MARIYFNERISMVLAEKLFNGINELHTNPVDAQETPIDTAARAANLVEAYKQAYKEILEITEETVPEWVKERLR